jgi:hypothetical protein
VINSIAVFIGVREMMASRWYIKWKEMPTVSNVAASNSRDSYDFLPSLSGTPHVDKEWTRKAYTSSQAGHSYIYKKRESGEATSSQNIHSNQILCNLVSWSDGTLKLCRLAVKTIR